MRIMIVHKYHYYRAGAETYALELGKLLERKGDEVMHFSMHHPKNLKYKHEKYFVPHIDMADELKSSNLASKIRVASTMFYSKIARSKFKEALDFFKPDVIHVHNIHKHLTISILYEAEKRAIPVVWSLHDYQLICPNYTFVCNGKICEHCKNSYIAPIRDKCVKGSLIASVGAVTEKLLNDLQQIQNKAKLFLAPSKFLMEKFIEFGYERNKMRYLHYFFNASKSKRTTNDKYFLYLGRLSYEKGVATLCTSASQSGVKLKILGDGPLREELEKKYGSKSIEFLGYKSGKELANLRKNAWFTVTPSEWYENNPFAIIESFSDGVPVIGARIGGIPELVDGKQRGYLFKPQDAEELTVLLKNTNIMTLAQRNKLGENARKYIQNEYGPDKHYRDIISIYAQARGN